MKYIFTTILLLLLFVSHENYGQRTPSISNINIKVNAKGFIEIHYDVSDLVQDDSIYVFLQKKDGTIIIPKSVSGEVGKGIREGINKVISWNIIEDNFIVNDEFQIFIEIKLAKEIPVRKLAGGVSNVLVSMIAPGIGNIFVNENKRIVLRTLITATFYGLLINGLIVKKDSDSQYAIYNSKLKESEALNYYTAANENHHIYYLMTRGAALIWAVEVISTFAKGLKNDKLRNQSHISLNVGTFMDTPTIGINYKF
jgi:hypothetical protein